MDQLNGSFESIKVTNQLNLPLSLPGWRVFDDYNVDNIDEGSIVTNNAYILFYRLNEQQPTTGNMEVAE